MSTGTVYVVQNHSFYDEKTGLTKPKFNLDPAKKFGDLVFLLSPMNVPSKPEAAIKKLRKKLSNFSDDDHLLCIGNPCFIGWAVAVASHANEGKVKMLQWNGERKTYYSISAEGLDQAGRTNCQTTKNSTTEMTS